MMINKLNIIFFIVATLLSLWTAYRMLAQGDRLLVRPLPQKFRAVIMLLVVFILLFVRVYKFGAIPGGFNVDGAMAAVDGKALADHGTDRYGMVWPVHLTAWGYGQMSALLSYLMIPFFKLFGMNPVSARLPLLLVSLLGLAILYLLCCKAWGKRAGLIVLAFAAVDPWHIMQSRWSLDCNLFPHFFLFGLYFLVLMLGEKRKSLWLCLSMLMFGLSMYCYGIAIYTVPFFLVLAAIYLLVTNRINWKELLIAIAVWLLVAWPFILTMAINFFKWDTIELPFMTLPYFKYSVRSNDILFFSDNFWQQLKLNLGSLCNIFTQGKDLLWNSIEQFGTLYLFSTPFAVVGLIYTIKERKNPASVLTILFLLTGIWCGVCTNTVNVNQANIIFYPLIILTGLGIWNVIERVGLPRLELGLTAMYLVMLCLFGAKYFGYIGDYTQQMEKYFMKDYGEAITAVKDTDAEKIYITTLCTDQEKADVSEILTLFYHDIDAEYFQGKRQIEGLLPYSQRYIYDNIANLEIDESEDAAYVIVWDDLALFDLEQYDVQQFGYYYTLTKVKG